MPRHSRSRLEFPRNLHLVLVMLDVVLGPGGMKTDDKDQQAQRHHLWTSGPKSLDCQRAPSERTGSGDKGNLGAEG